MVRRQRDGHHSAHGEFAVDDDRPLGGASDGENAGVRRIEDAGILPTWAVVLCAPSLTASANLLVGQSKYRTLAAKPQAVDLLTRAL